MSRERILTWTKAQLGERCRKDIIYRTSCVVPSQRWQVTKLDPNPWLPSSHPCEHILSASFPPKTPSDDTGREPTKGLTGHHSCLVTAVTSISSEGIFSSFSFSPARSKRWQVPNRPFYRGFCEGRENHASPSQLQFPRKRSLGLLNSSWHTLPQTCNCCRFQGQSLGEERPSISGPTIWPLLSVGPFFSMPEILSLQVISSRLQHRHPLCFLWFLLESPSSLARCRGSFNPLLVSSRWKGRLCTLLYVQMDILTYSFI